MSKEKSAGASGRGVATREAAHAIGAQIMGAAGAAPDHLTHRAAPPDTRYWAKRTFDYCGRTLDRGQIFRLKGVANDKLMLDLDGYFAPFADGAPIYACNRCGEEFKELAMLEGHGKARHDPKRFVPPSPPIREDGEKRESYENRLDEWRVRAGRMADASEDSRDRHENEVAPLDLTRTQASREA